MIRLLGSPVSGYNLARLTAEAQAAWPQVVAVNDVAGEPAFYFEANAPTQAQVDALVAAHVNTPLPPSNDETLRARAEQALTVNADFLAMPSWNNAQTLAQVKALTRECSAVIRLLLGRTETTDGT